MRTAPLFLATSILLATASAQLRDGAMGAQTAPTAARVALEQMSSAERMNARISLEFESPREEDVVLGREVEHLWNNGQHAEALAQLGNLEARVGHVAVGNSWRTPVATLADESWGADVRIGNRDSLLGVALDFDPASGNLFVALRHSGGAPHWSVCMSPDYGATWVETFTWIGSPSTWLDAAVLRHYAYVVYNSPGENPQQVRARRFRCGDGSSDTFSTGANWVVACTLDLGDTMEEVSLVNYIDSRVYMTVLVSDGSVLFAQANANGVPWNQRSTGITSGASCGLAATDNPETDTIWYFFSYYDASDTLRVWRWSWSGFTQRLALFAGRSTPTSISAYHDTVVCVFEDETFSPHRVRYAIHLRDDNTWTTGALSHLDIAAEAPAVLARSGGFAALYRQSSPVRTLRFCRRAYSGFGSAPASIADNEPYWSRPGIEYLGGGVFGVAYLSNVNPVVRGAYFDRSDWAYGVAESSQPPASSYKPQATVVRGVLSLPRDMTETPDVSDRVPRHTLLDISGRNVLDLTVGANDVSALSPGVYFVRSAPSAASRQPSAVTKVVVTR